jgi:hypothetical protein
VKRIALASVFVCCATSLFAQSARTFVSGSGVDSGTCPITTPCRTFAFALPQTAAGGDIVALDSAGYGPVSINKAINILAPAGILAGVTQTTPFTSAIAISASSGDVIRLQGLHLVALGSNITGISVGTCKRLEVKDLEVENFNTALDLPTDTRVLIEGLKISAFNTAVWAHGTASATSNMKVFIFNTTITGGNVGVKVDGGSVIMSRSDSQANRMSFVGIAYQFANETAVSGCTEVNLGQNGEFNGAGTDLRNGMALNYTACQAP